MQIKQTRIHLRENEYFAGRILNKAITDSLRKVRKDIASKKKKTVLLKNLAKKRKEGEKEREGRREDREAFRI